METYIQEWSDIQHIVTDKSFDTFLSDEASRSKQDFCVIDSVYLGAVQLTTTQIDLYCCMVRSTRTNVVYILFSSGIVLTKSDLEQRELNDRLHILIGKIIQNKLHVHVLAGHSMGCVLALYTGYLMFSADNHVFRRHIVVLGTAGARWMLDDHHYASYTNLPNVKLFLSGELRHYTSKSKMLLDGYAKDGFGHGYQPLFVIYMDKEEGKVFEIPHHEIQCQIEYPDKNNSQSQKFHNWSYYKRLLKTIYNIEHVGDAVGLPIKKGSLVYRWKKYS